MKNENLNTQQANDLYNVLGVVYIVGVNYGRYEDYTEEIIFATKDKDKAEKWRDRFNKIIHDNADRTYIKYEESGFTIKPFGYDKIHGEEYTAYIEEVGLR
jgi:hypothetical protein